ncbi:MAG: hypothetical protein J1E63_07490 [Muribaculaceae bacterium]|nr:hypothetical protein [Muribaculaceae bacterium]
MEIRLNFKLVVTSLVVLFAIVLGLMFGIPAYRVWSQEMEGKAELAKAEQNRKIKIAEAEANLEAEKLNAKAEIERAKGAAEAIRIENGSLTPTYIQYLWVRQQNLNPGDKVIYVPTETGLPILEAGRNLLR